MKNVFLYIAIGLFLVSCDSSKNKNDAESLLDRARAMYNADSLHSAKVLIDSIHSAFSKDISVRKQAKKLMLNIEYAETKRNLEYIDSVLILRGLQKDSIRGRFKLSSDSCYTNKKTYIHWLQKRYYTARISLQCEVQANGDISLISVYGGYKLNATKVQVSCGDVFVDTDEIQTDNVLNNQFLDGNTWWQYISFNPEMCKNIFSFVSMYSDCRIKAKLIGKSSYAYYLDKNNITIIKESAKFSAILKDLTRLNKDRIKQENKLLWIQEKLNK